MAFGIEQPAGAEISGADLERRCRIRWLRVDDLAEQLFRLRKALAEQVHDSELQLRLDIHRRKKQRMLQGSGRFGELAGCQRRPPTSHQLARLGWSGPLRRC